MVFVSRLVGIVILKLLISVLFILSVFLAALEHFFTKNREKFREATGCKNIARMKVYHPAGWLRVRKS